MEYGHVMDIAVHHLVANGDSKFLRNRQPHLNQRTSLYPLLVMSILAEVALLAIEIGIGDVI